MSYRNADFEREFFKAFDGRFRIRWSDMKQEYHIEQKVRRGLEIEPAKNEKTGILDTYSDEYIRARDGYFYVMAIRAGDKMPCPICGLTVPVPQLHTAESHCEYCKVMGRDGRYIAAYYPLNNVLIEHIKTLDPHTDGPVQSRKRIRAAQLKFEAEKQSKALDAADDMIKFNNNQVMNVPMTGYGSQKTHQNDDGSRIEIDRLYR